MVSCSIYDCHYDQALCDLGASINIFPKVIFEQLQYPALSPTLMYVQLADSTIRHFEGIVENLFVQIKNSFVLANFMVLDMKGDLGIHLMLRQPFLRDVKAWIDVWTEEIHFRIRVNNIFFKFQYRKEQRFMIHQGHDGGGIWGEPLPKPETPPITQAKRKKTKKVWRKVESVSSSTSPQWDTKW
jgi:hypothetical protein